VTEQHTVPRSDGVKNLMEGRPSGWCHLAVTTLSACQQHVTPHDVVLYPRAVVDL